MSQIDLILKYFIEDSEFSGLRSLWFECDNQDFREASTILESRSNQQIIIEYDPDTAFFKVLLILLEGGQCCLYHNLNGEDPSRDGEHLNSSPIEQVAMYKKAWVGKQAMDAMDEENNYMGWWFLNYARYSLAWRRPNEQGELKWWHAE
jgi:hypothetical protein